METDQMGSPRALLPMALGGVAFGLGCAAKWTGIYAGAGLAVLYLCVLYARWQQKRPGFRAEFRTAAVGGVLFYVLLPLCLYIGSYLPYWWRDPAFSLSDWWQCQVSMFSYHATLKATHPFESRWYTWLLGLRPVWYYRNGYLPYGMKASIAGMAGPVIWLVGLAALVGLLWHQVSGRGSRQGAGVLILYGTQLIPWMLVTRCTFLYHYFPSSMFCLAALSLVLALSATSEVLALSEALADSEVLADAEVLAGSEALVLAGSDTDVLDGAVEAGVLEEEESVPQATRDSAISAATARTRTFFIVKTSIFSILYTASLPAPQSAAQGHL